MALGAYITYADTREASAYMSVTGADSFGSEISRDQGPGGPGAGANARHTGGPRSAEQAMGLLSPLLPGMCERARVQLGSHVHFRRSAVCGELAVFFQPLRQVVEAVACRSTRLLSGCCLNTALPCLLFVPQAQMETRSRPLVMLQCLTDAHRQPPAVCTAACPTRCHLLLATTSHSAACL